MRSRKQPRIQTIKTVGRLAELLVRLRKNIAVINLCHNLKEEIGINLKFITLDIIRMYDVQTTVNYFIYTSGLMVAPSLKTL